LTHSVGRESGRTRCSKVTRWYHTDIPSWSERFAPELAHRLVASSGLIDLGFTTWRRALHHAQLHRVDSRGGSTKRNRAAAVRLRRRFGAHPPDAATVNVRETGGCGTAARARATDSVPPHVSSPCRRGTSLTVTRSESPGPTLNQAGTKTEPCLEASAPPGGRLLISTCRT